jgi:nitroreductase
MEKTIVNSSVRGRLRVTKFSKAKISLLVLAAMLQAADVLTTNGFLSLPGAFEGNPMIGAAQDSFGQFWWVPKILFLPAILYVLATYRRLWPALVVVALYSFIVTNNLYVIATARGLGG